MDPTVSFEQFAADRLIEDSAQITRSWVDRLSKQTGIRPRAVLPTHELLDHIPEVLGKAATFIRSGKEDPFTTQQIVTDELKNVARLRRKQGYDVQEVIREFDDLAQLLDGAALHWIDQYPGTPEPKSVGRVFGRLNRAPLLMGEITVGMYREEELDSRYAVATQLRDFADTLTHQFKTPLGAAAGAAMLLENDDLAADPVERRRYARIVQRNLKRAGEVVDDVRLLTLAQLAHAKAGRFLPLAQVLGQVLSEVSPFADEQGVRIEIEEPIPDFVVDASRVEIVLLNLISNAAKYADPGKPVRWVRVGFEQRAGEEWWVRVQDNGLGIPAELQGRIFERFFRAHPDSAEGTGLGLSIVREAIQQLESRLELDSEPATGTTFRFLLPKPAEETMEA